MYRVGDRWRGSIFINDEDGRRTRRYVSGDTQAEALAKLRTAQADATAAAELAKSPTLAWWATRWQATARLRVGTPRSAGIGGRFSITYCLRSATGPWPTSARRRRGKGPTRPTGALCIPVTRR